MMHLISFSSSSLFLVLVLVLVLENTQARADDEDEHRLETEILRMGDRAVYCARLESVCAERHPGFESPPIRHAFCLRLTSRLRRDALRVFCAFLLFTRLAPVVSGETALEISNLLEKAKGNLNQGNLGAALTLLDQIDKAKGGNSESLDLRGTIYLEQGKLDEAKKAFRAASEADAQRFPPRLHFADVLLREKRFSDARDIYTDLMEKLTSNHTMKSCATLYF